MRLPSRKIALAALGFTFGSRVAQAQIVNTEPLLRYDEKKPFAFFAEGSLSGQRGNTQLSVLGLKSAGRLRLDRHEGLIHASHERAAASSEVVGERTFGHVRYRYYFTERVQAELFGQLSRDPFRLMTHRLVAGAGPRFVPLVLGPLSWTVSAAHMYEVERLDGSVDFDGGITRKRHRLNLMSSARVAFERVTLQQTIYLQPAWADPSNIRILHLFDAQAAISKYVSVTWSMEQALDTIAPSDVRPFDLRFKGGLKFDL